MDFDSMIDDNDPQSAVASEGLEAGAKALYNSQPVQNAVTGKGLDDYQTILTNAIAGDKDAQQALAAHSLGTAMGTVEAPKQSNLGTVANDIKQSNVITDSKGVQTPVVNGKPNYGKVIQKMADGGEVADLSGQDFDSITESAPQTPHPPQADMSGQDFDAIQDDESRYTSGPQQAIAGAEGFARGLAGPAATLAEKALGVSDEGINNRQKYNPGTAALAESGGLGLGMFIGTGEGALIGKVGSKVAESIGQGGNLAKLIGRAAASGAVENALVQAGDEVSKLITSDPNQSAQTALVDTGLSGLIGGGVGATLGAVSPLWKALAGNKLGQIVEDFRGRINDHIADPDLLESVTKELSDYYNNTKSVTDGFYGPTGLKAQDIAKSMPEMSVDMLKQAADISDKVKSSIDKMVAKPNTYPERLVSKLQTDLQAFQTAVSDHKSPGDIFNAIQDLKQTTQGYAKFDKMVTPIDEGYDFVRDAKSLAHDLRLNLEDSKVWGKAAERQQAINKAFSEYGVKGGPLANFEAKFTTEVNGERVVDPGKVNTYLNQINKPNGDIKKQVLENFLDASDKYRNVIEATHANLGLDSPLVQSPLNATKSTLKERTAGSKLADILIQKGLTEGAGKASGAAVGAILGHAVGSSEVGALLGAHALGPLFSSVLPTLAKPIINGVANAAGAKAATDFTVAVAKGENLLNKSIKNLFTAGKEVFPKAIMVSDRDRERLNDRLKEIQTDPTKLTSVGGDVGHYLPGHQTAMASTAASASNFLNSLRPDRTKQNPLDSPTVPSPDQKAKYTRALNIAQQPLVVMQSIKEGTITPSDVLALRTLYPSLYNSMSAKILNEMNNTLSKKQAVPYKTRMGLSMFLGQPLDSTMTPNGIMSAQPAPQQAPASGQPKAPVKRKTAALTKLPNQYQSKSQAAEADQIERQ